MSIEIIRSPETTNDDTTVCKFSTGFNPLYFEISRKDKTISSSSSFAGFLQVTLDSVTGLSVNDEVYVLGKDASDNIIVSQTAKIFDITGNAISVLILATNPINLITQGWVNSVSSVKREIEISGSGFTTRRFSYNSFGTVKCYLNGIVRELFESVYDVQETGIGIVDGACVEIDITFEDVETGDTVDTSEEYYAVKAVKQIGTDNRMVEYEVYSYSSVNSTAKYLTAFEKPVIFRGYPFHLYCLLGRNDDTLYNRVTEGALTQDIPFPSQNKEVYSIAISPTAGVRNLTSKIITNVAENEKYLNIDNADNNLLIDATGNKLRIN